MYNQNKKHNFYFRNRFKNYLKSFKVLRTRVGNPSNLTTPSMAPCLNPYQISFDLKRREVETHSNPCASSELPKWSVITHYHKLHLTILGFEAASNIRLEFSEGELFFTSYFKLSSLLTTLKVWMNKFSN